MKFPEWLPVFGDTDFRGNCPVEDVEHINFVTWVKWNYPDVARCLIHPKNEGKRTFAQANKEKKMGLSKGAADIVIPGCPSFVCEIKRADHTKSKWQDGQQEYLESAMTVGSYTCVVLGSEAAKLALLHWLKLSKNRNQ